MAGIMVSASTGAMNSVLGKLAILKREEFSKHKNLQKEVKSISDELRSMNNFLERLSDVDEPDKKTKGWRDEVREMSYDIDDIIDDFRQHVGEKGENSGIVNSTIERLKTLMAHHRIATPIKDIKKLVLETSKQHKRYDHHIAPSSDVSIDQRVVALYANGADLVGVEGPANELIDWLKDKEKQLKVISIWGMGGIGKTTLANEVYHRLKGDFACGAFVPLSMRPNIQKLLHGLLSQLLGSKPSYHYYELNVLLNKLREHLQAKRYFVIIDDIWDEHAWHAIKCAFPDNGLGSRIIVTTRSESVVKCCSDPHGHILKMEPISDKDSRRLFFGRIFRSEEACPEHLRNVSGEIIKHLVGLPLVIIIISGMLASEGSNQKARWELVRNSLGSRTNCTLERNWQILNLSYRDLPPHLKTCFLYLGMYPENYIIQRSNLELQWIAEGFISKENGQDMAKTASNVFNELVNRSLIQPIFDNRGSVTKCRVHDIILQFILGMCFQENFLTVVDDRCAFERLEFKPRRLSIRFHDANNGPTILPRDNSMSQVRSIMFFGGSQDTPPLSVFKVLRVLFIDLDNATVNLTGLCKLYQLRYLWINN